MAHDKDASFLTSEEIRDCEDEDTLLDWHDELMDMFDGVVAHLEVRGGLPITTRDWLIRAADKASAVRANIRRVERQLRNCGFELPVVVAGEPKLAEGLVKRIELDADRR